MDTPDLLDILGNENRRNILSLLSNRPCYVTEISEELKVSPKAIIDHLKILEEAGIVESFHDQQSRKYYQIANNVRIEVAISPLTFQIEVTKVEAGANEQKMLRDRIETDRISEDVAGALKYLCEEARRLNQVSAEHAVRGHQHVHRDDKRDRRRPDRGGDPLFARQGPHRLRGDRRKAEHPRAGGQVGAGPADEEGARDLQDRPVEHSVSIAN